MKNWGSVSRVVDEMNADVQGYSKAATPGTFCNGRPRAVAPPLSTGDGAGPARPRSRPRGTAGAARTHPHEGDTPGDPASATASAAAGGGSRCAVSMDDVVVGSRPWQRRPQGGEAIVLTR